MTGHIRGSFFYHLLASLPLLTLGAAIVVAKVARVNQIRVPWKALTALLVGFLILEASAYVVLPILLDDAESGVAGASAQAILGRPVYPAPSAAARYGLVYGPITSLWHIPFYYVFGKNLYSFKLAGVLAFLLSLAGLYQIGRKYADKRASLLGLGCASVILFQYMGYDYWGRSDPLILLLLAASVLFTIDGPDWVTVAVASVTFGVLPNLKISAVMYLLPILGFVVIRRGWRVASLSAGLSVGLFALPFALPQVSATNYLFLLNVVKNQGLNPDFLVRNIQYTVILLAPLLLLAPHASKAFQPWSMAQRYYLGLLVCAMAGTCVFGSKIGAGNYHLFPYVVSCLHLYFWRRSELPAEARDGSVSRFAAPWVATLLFYSTTHVVDSFREYAFAPHGAAAFAEIRAAESTYPGRKIEVGVGDKSDEARISYGPALVFHGQTYNMNFQSVRDTQMGNVDLPEATFRYIRNCETDIWLIPKNQSPFAASNSYYDTYHPAFPENFRKLFEASYRKAASGPEFDVWVCAEEEERNPAPRFPR